MIRTFPRDANGPLLGVLLLFGWLPSASAQVSLGVAIGGIVTDDFASSEGMAYTPSSERLLIGPTFRMRTHSGLGVEVAALRKGLGFQYRLGRPGLGLTEYRADATMWQFPLLLQYGRTLGGVTPYVSAGPTLRWISGGTETGQNCTQLPSVVCTPFSRTDLSDIENRTTAGILVGAGVDVGMRLFRLSPEVRFTRWLEQSFRALPASDSQVELLLRIAIPVTRN